LGRVVAVRIPRMPRVGRRAIDANPRSRANRRAVLRVEAVVARLTEAAESAKPEDGIITVMGLDVICDRRWHDQATFQAEPA
jgi:hypothetical protein